jgi:hypothetical protein
MPSTSEGFIAAAMFWTRWFLSTCECQECLTFALLQIPQHLGILSNACAGYEFSILWQQL